MAEKALNINPISVVDGEKVTISDCGKALYEIDRELAKLSIQQREIERRKEALLTQGLIINELVRRIA